MTLRLKFISESAKARLYENKADARHWIPRSVTINVVKFPFEPGKPIMHEVSIEDWWLEKNPWPTSKQGRLL